MLNKVRIVLVNTSHPGNIGATARAMKTMGLQKLYLVQPHSFPDPEANARASGADDLLEQACVVPDLNQALADCHLVIGTSSRSRALPWPLMTPRECAERVRVEPEKQNIAIVFGREKSGLTNAELASCHYHVNIPTHNEYQSLNLAAAVQIIAYELFLQSCSPPPSVESFDERATSAELDSFYAHFEQTMQAIKYVEPATSFSLMQRVKRLFNRTQLEKSEINILRGILKAMNQWTKNT